MKHNPQKNGASTHGQKSVGRESRLLPTKAQKRLYDAIVAFIKREGYSPSFEEIGRETGLKSLATISKHVSQLHAKGLIRRSPGQSRSIEPVNLKLVEVPA